MDNVTKAQHLSRQGKSLREIATELGVSKSTVSNYLKRKPVEKGWLNPTWQTVSGGDPSPVDNFGVIPAPDAEKLLQTYEDTVYFCTDYIAQAVGSTPLGLYVGTTPGQPQPKCLTQEVQYKTATWLSRQHPQSQNTKQVMEHPVLGLMDTPNPEMSQYDCLHYIDTQLSLAGEAYVRKQRDEDGYTSYLWPLQTQYCEIQADENGKIVALKYNVRQPPVIYPWKDVIHFKLLNPLDPYGKCWSPARAVYERIFLAKNELSYLNSLFRNQARFDSLICVKDATADQSEQLQKQLSQRFRQGGMGGPWVVPDGEYEVKPLSWSPKDVLGVELYKWTKLQIINAYKLNPALFDTESSNRAVATQAKRDAEERAILPRLRQIEQKLNRGLVDEFDTRLFLAFDSPVQEDEEFELNRRNQLVDRAVITVNEYRQQLGLPPVAWGDKPYEKGGGARPETMGKIAKEAKFNEGKHPRAADGKFGSGGGGGGSKKPSKKPTEKPAAEHGDAHAEAHAEPSGGKLHAMMNAAKATYEGAAKAIYDHSPKPVQKVMDYGNWVHEQGHKFYHAGQELAKHVAAESGLSDTQVEYVGHACGWLDFYSTMVMNWNVAHTALSPIGGPVIAFAAAKAVAFVPTASLGYVGYKMGQAAVQGKNPVALISKARARMKAAKERTTRTGYVKPKKEEHG